jgi:hypothetical protein
VEHGTIQADDDKALVLPLVGYLKPGQGLHRKLLFDQLCSLLPKEAEVKVQIEMPQSPPGKFHRGHNPHPGLPSLAA